LREVTRIPVCRRCLKAPQPLSAEFFCVSCRTPFQNAFPLDAEGRCALCRSGLRGFDAAYCFGAYEGVLRELIHLYKYGKIQTLARPLGDLLAAALPRDQEWNVLVPVPLHWRRQWERGFNQSELLARSIARRTAIPVVNALRRTHATLTQAQLSNTNRRRNVTNAFRCKPAAAVAGKRILLIDDVMTTGSTGAACALALKRAGALKVALLTVARVDRRLSGARLLVGPSDVLQPAVLQPGELQPEILQAGVLQSKAGGVF
jgi:ComF family protein